MPVSAALLRWPVIAMDDLFELKAYPDHIHLRPKPGSVISPATTPELWPRIAEICRERGLSKVLIEAGKFEGRSDTMTAFDSGRALAESMSDIMLAICFCDREFDELTTFFKTVAQNRGVSIELFFDIEEAVRWLDVDTGERSDSFAGLA